MPSRDRRWLSIVACLVVATMFLGVGLDNHTDDGCRIEVHCVVCRTHLTSVATQISAPSLEVVGSLDIAQPDHTLTAVDVAAPSTLALRGPPLA